jgi:hypothetical protein
LFVPLAPEPEKLELTLARIAHVVGQENVGYPVLLDTHRPDAFRVVRFTSPEPRSGDILPEKHVSASKFPLLDRRGGCAIKKKAAFLAGADGVVDQAPQRMRTAAQALTYLPPRRSRSKTIARVCPSSPGGEICSAYTSSHAGGSQNVAATRLTIAFRQFRPALEATVQLRNGVPAWIAFRGLFGPITTASGPWNSSGDWWREDRWAREEWDVGIAARSKSLAMYRIYRDCASNRWFVDGVYD